MFLNIAFLSNLKYIFKLHVCRGFSKLKTLYFSLVSMFGVQLISVTWINESTHGCVYTDIHVNIVTETSMSLCLSLQMQFMQLRTRTEIPLCKWFYFLVRGWEGEKHQCVVVSHAPPPEDLAHNPGMSPDRESNWWPFGSQASIQSTEPHQPELKFQFLKCWLSSSMSYWVSLTCDFTPKYLLRNVTAHIRAL